MMKMGSSEGWIGRIMSCIASVSFTFKINGGIHREVFTTQGGLDKVIQSPPSFFFFVQTSSRF